MKTLDISQVSRFTGLTTATIRYYETKGLIQPVGRKGIKRVYSADILTRLSLIILAKQAEFSLDEIVAILANLTDSGIDRTILQRKISDIEDQIALLDKLKNGLKHIEQCPEENHLQCPRFQRILVVNLQKNISKLQK